MPLKATGNEGWRFAKSPNAWRKLLSSISITYYGAAALKGERGEGGKKKKPLHTISRHVKVVTLCISTFWERLLRPSAEPAGICSGARAEQPPPRSERSGGRAPPSAAGLSDPAWTTARMETPHKKIKLKKNKGQKNMSMKGKEAPFFSLPGHGN